jgi:ABC-type phosphate transport system substrate-binding protein
MKGLILALLLVLIALPLEAVATRDAVSIIVPAGLEIESLDHSAVNRIFLGKTRQWQNRESIVMTVNRDKEAMALFCEQLAHKTPRQFFMYWRKQLYSGHSMLPKQFDTDQQIINFVAEHPNSIGFIASPVTDPRVKELVISP